MGKNYTIGLDIGTASVGWAVIDDEFNLAQGKKRINDNGTKRKTKTNLWGVRLFDEGETAEERRLKRGLRRRYTRRHERLNYLRGIFEPEITKVDESFLIRLDESFYQADDKKALEYKFRDKNGNLITKKVQNKEIYKYPLFKTEKEEKEYYKTYPTIYHLREHLMKSEEKEDIRLVYLAMHHILKYRGHFVNQGQNFDLKNIDIVNSLRETLIMFETAINFAMGFDFDETNLENANEILKDRTKSKSQKAYLLNQLYVIDAEAVYLKGNESLTVAFEEKTEKQQEKFIEGKQKQIKDLFNALVGNKIAFDRIFDNKEYSTKENDDFPKDVYYKNENFDEAITTLEEFLAPEELDVIIQGKKVYESIILAGILTKETLAASMVERYDCHKADLEELKCFSKRISGSLFKKIFSEQYPIKEEKEEKEEEKKDKKEKVVYEVGVYSKYINGSGNPSKRLKREDFY
ncbi:MAG: type II CRISPR RNA-guided endonuclease Cas9, partial [Clostridiales bacterium]|nr:type II CRISPR RNA-guided endonuclease Cas9 [Clostridiales bacterium]